MYVGFSLLFLLSGIIGISTYFVISQHEEISQKINHIYEVISLADHTKYLVKEMENCELGARSTPQKIFSEKYYQSRDEARSELTMLSKEAAAVPGQLARVSLLEQQINDLTFFWSKLRLDARKYDSAAMAKVTTEENNKIDLIDANVTAIVAYEHAMLTQSDAENSRILHFMSWASPAGSIAVQAVILILILMVITELRKRKKAETELRKIIAKEKDISEMKSRFITTASHEFRTPLTTILASTQLAEKYTTTDDQPKRVKHYQRVAAAVQHLTDLLNDLLSVEKLELGKVNINFEEFNLEDYIRSRIEEMQTALKPGQKIEYIHNGMPIVSLDTTIMKYIICNLLSNAIKFSNENDVVLVKSHHHFDLVMISVRDYGIGILEKDMDNLFERFHRAANAKNIEGTGLGLSVVYKCTHLLNGRIKCITEEGAGTEFILTFPQKESKHAA